MGLHGKVLIAGGGYRGGFCEKVQEVSLYLIKPVSADPPRTKAKPIYDGGTPQ